MAEQYDISGNMSGNGTNCYDNYCIEATLYRKITGSILFLLVWPFIVLDIKRFPLGRPAAALVGAVLMVLFTVVPQDQVYIILGNKGNLQTLFLLIGMMLLSYYYDREGILQHITLWIFGKDKPFKFVLWKVCVLSAILSAIITNDATCLVLTPLLLAEHMKQERPTKEYPPLLLGIATSSNIGSASTFFGNPQNAFIAANSRGQVSLFIFFVSTLPAAIIGLFVSVTLLYLCYFRTMWPKKKESILSNDVTATATECNETTTANGVAIHLPEETLKNNGVRHGHEELALSYDKSYGPHLTSRISQEREDLFSSSENSAKVRPHGKPHQNGFAVKNERETSMSEVVTSNENSSSPDYGAIQNYNHLHNHILSGRVSRFQARSSSDRFGSSMQLSNALIREVPSLDPQDDKTHHQTSSESRSTWQQRFFIGWLFLVTCILVILLALPPPPVLQVEFNLGLVPIAAGVMTILMDTIVNKNYAFDAMMKVDWTMILMFMGLFIWLGGFENTLFPTDIFNLMSPYMDLYTLKGMLLFTLFVVVGSNVLSNVPLVILIMEELFNFQCGTERCTGQLTGVILAWISTIAGNFTLIGSVANLIVMEKARHLTNYRLSFWEYLKFGFCSTLLVLFIGLPIVYFAGDNVHI